MAVLAIIGLLMIAFGVSYITYALAVALAPSLGVAGGAAVTGAVFVGPPLVWALIFLILRRAPPPKPAPAPAPNGLWLSLFAAIAKETPWMAIIGTGAIAAVEMFLASRRKK